MFDLRILENAAERITALLPADARVLREEFKANVRPLLEAMLNRMDLVTRDEFDAQVRVLERTRAKLAALEAELAALDRDAHPG